MSVVVLLIVAGGTVAGGFPRRVPLGRVSGQFDDVETPAVRMLRDDAAASSPMLSKDARTHDHD